MKLSLPLLFCFLTVVGIVSSYSQDTDEELQEYFDMSMEELMNIEVSVASKNSESFINSPSSVYVFTSAEIENMGVNSVEELLNYVPGYFTGLDIEQGKAFRIGARGRSTALSESVLFLVNGHRINDLYTGGVSIINRLIPVENIKQIEVIRGPGSSLYGSNAFLGVVNIVTKENTNDIQFTYGSFRGISAAGNFSTNAGGVALSGFIRGFSNEGYKFNDFEDLLDRSSDMTDPEQGFDAMLGVQYKGLKLEARHHEREFKGFYGLGGVADFNNNEQSSQSMVNMSYNMAVGEKIILKVRTGYRLENWKTKQVLVPAGVDGMTEDFFAGPFMKSTAYSFNIDASYKLGRKNELLTGISYENAGIDKSVSLTTHDFVSDSFTYFGGIREYYLSFNNNTDKRNIFGFFVQDRYVFNDRLRATFGARLDSYSDFGSSINPRGAIIYSTPINSTLKVMYGQAFRAPNYLELYDQNNPVDYGNTELKAEEIRTFELAYTHNLSIFSATATYFNNTIKNLIFLNPAAPPVLAENNPLEAFSFYNLPDDVNTAGLEIATILKPVEALSFTATFTHLVGDYTFMPENMASARINYKFGLFNLNINGIHHGEIKEISNQSNYTVVNAKLSFTTNEVTVFGKANNITDEVYRTPTVLSDVGVVNRGRVMTLGMKVKL